MAEKGELPSDQVSLPPTYASSDTFTESPPPAYRKQGVAAIRVARIVGITVFSVTFLIGFFIIAHKYINNKDCNCAEQIQLGASPLVAEAGFANFDLDNNEIEDLVKQEQRNEDQSPLEVAKDIVQIENAKHAMSQEIRDIQNDLNEETHEVKLPIDMLLGNPQLTGRDVQCKVQKKQKKIGFGVMTEAIIVTCNGEDEAPQDVVADRPIAPPLSFLGNIMKAFATRAQSQQRKPEILETINEPFMIPIHPPPPHARNMQRKRLMRPMPRPFPMPMGKNMMHFTPLNRFEGPRVHPSGGMRGRPIPIFPQEGPFPHILPIKLIRGPKIQREIPPFPAPYMRRPEVMPQQPFPFPSPNRPIKIVRVIKRGNEIEEGPVISGAPMPFSSLPMSNFPPRRPHILRFLPKPIREEPMSLTPLTGAYPLARGALPMEPIADNSNQELFPLHMSMPEAKARALPAPLALPGMKLLHLPFSPAMPFHEAKISTHMEIRDEDGEKPLYSSEDSLPQTIGDFGPPKIHTVIESAPEDFLHEETPHMHEPHHQAPFHEEPIALPQFQTSFMAPPPPSFEREGRFSPMAEVNEDAEIINEEPL